MFALMVVRIKRLRFRENEVLTQGQGKMQSIIINKVSVLSGCP